MPSRNGGEADARLARTFSNHAESQPKTSCPDNRDDACSADL